MKTVLPEVFLTFRAAIGEDAEAVRVCSRPDGDRLAIRAKRPARVGVAPSGLGGS